VSLIVDALDECADVKSFMKSIGDLTQESNIALLLTSRDEVEARLAISPFAKIQMSLSGRMRNDICTFLVREVHDRIAQKTLKIKAKSLDNQIVTTLAGKADGM
jgi:hypothetical protein